VRRELRDGRLEVQYHSAGLARSSVLRGKPYQDLYAEQLAARAYNIKMLDGALIQMSYEFAGALPVRSRLAFLPSPDLTEFQAAPELYLEDLMYTEVVDPRAVTVPIRFDFDDRPGVATELAHPRAHLTLGQYKNCRIATTAPLTPGAFVGFLLRSFYNTAMTAITGGSPVAEHRFAATISGGEQASIHIAVP